MHVMSCMCCSMYSRIQKLVRACVMLVVHASTLNKSTYKKAHNNLKSSSHTYPHIYLILDTQTCIQHTAHINK
jgi:hypothetical protein